jgi:hypothetical protein
LCAGDARAAVSDKLLADVRPQAVGTDEKRTFDPLARSKESGHGRPLILVGAHFAFDAKFGERMLTAGAQEDPVQITAMHYGVGIAEPGAGIPRRDRYV